MLILRIHWLQKHHHPAARMPFGRKSTLEALIMPGTILVYKYNQFRQRRREAATRRVTERELTALHHKIVSKIFFLKHISITMWLLITCHIIPIRLKEFLAMILLELNFAKCCGLNPSIYWKFYSILFQF